MSNKVLSEKELAAELGLSPWTIRTLRLQKGLPHFRTAGRIFYRIEVVTAWIEAQEKTGNKAAPESEYGTLRAVK